jgi:hypothetical protein
MTNVRVGHRQVNRYAINVTACLIEMAYMNMSYNFHAIVTSLDADVVDAMSDALNFLQD